MRKLYYVRIIHSPEELGSLTQPLIDVEKRLHGPQAEQNYREKVKRFWEEIQRKIVQNKLNTPDVCRKLHIYVDGLPVKKFYCKTCFDKEGKQYFMKLIEDNQIQCPGCGRKVQETEDVETITNLVKSLIEMKLPMYLTIEKLIEKGARIHATESLELLLEERSIWQEAVKGITPDSREMDELLQERDKFISQRINQMLPKNEIGILFIGAAHRVDEELRKFSDIKVIYF